MPTVTAYMQEEVLELLEAIAEHSREPGERRNASRVLRRLVLTEAQRLKLISKPSKRSKRNVVESQSVID